MSTSKFAALSDAELRQLEIIYHTRRLGVLRGSTFSQREYNLWFDNERLIKLEVKRRQGVTNGQ